MKKYILLVFIAISMVNCSDEVWRGIPTSENAPAPPPVTNVQVTATPGGADITYTLPESDILLYVMAEYSIGNRIISKKSSFYSAHLIIEGFPDTKEYNLKLYSVSRDGMKSDPVNVSVTPLTPPIVSIFNSIVMEPTFGGIKIHFENDSEAEVKLTVLTTDSDGEIYPVDIYYTKRKDGNFSIRGFDAEERTFGLYVLDRWNNYSDTIFVNLEPWFEEQLDKFKFRAMNLPSDTNEAHSSSTYTLDQLWNNVWGTGAAFHTKPNTGIPQWFTFDLGAKARLSRFKFHHRLAGSSGAGSDGQYSAGDPQIMEVYGSNNPNPDGSWDSWTLLGTFESIKPSGLASGWTTEDIQFACYDGEDFEFPDIEPVRYLRFRVTKVWGGVTYIYIGELTFWGEVLETF
ncbi:DUF5000 domain-containing lipoprotein [Proteiniphilum sp.]|uniref:DUF5000 domain-containing lipoprotein n=1 Tax=Proteiniphilum sp. TaxID=1926877 RepID=UPI002B210B31|nr:DUF5000 domain-containing lipoprotein [Proteiniphilum sp.]MEA4917885.1 DUF5000 domain-containing lipoprotein [Proteiniphilum sp.]